MRLLKESRTDLWIVFLTTLWLLLTVQSLYAQTVGYPPGSPLAAELEVAAANGCTPARYEDSTYVSRCHACDAAGYGWCHSWAAPCGPPHFVYTMCWTGYVYYERNGAPPPTQQPSDPFMPDKNAGSPHAFSCVGNPVNAATGNKYEGVVDISLSTPGIPLEFSRAYNSQAISDGPLGFGWTHTFNMTAVETAVVVDPSTSYMRVKITDGDGRAMHFTNIAGTSNYFGESGVKDRLKKDGTEYVLRRKEGNLTYRFGSDGKLSQISHANSNTLALTHTTNTLTVSNNFGQTIAINYNTEGRISSVVDPKGQSISYTYTNGDLTRVTYPQPGNESITYAYANHRLTGKYDTSNNLAGYWSYDSSGNVQTHYRFLNNGVPQERLDFSYNLSDPSPTVTVTRSNGATTYTMDIMDGVRVIKDIDGCGATCGGNHKQLDYDGLYGPLNPVKVTTYVSGNDRTTHYTYDNPTHFWDQLGEVTEVTDASGTTKERKTRYSYVPANDPNNPFIMSSREERRTSATGSGDKIITTTYDSSGNVYTREENGYRLINGSAQQTTIKTKYLYNSSGQLTYVYLPDTVLLVELTYYANNPGAGNNRGQLQSIKYKVGSGSSDLVTSFSGYDANGNVGSVTENDVETTYTYDERNRVKTASTEGAQTKFSYDGRGNIDYVVLPEGEDYIIDFTYNLADRLTEVKDPLGNKVVYRYDSEGNRNHEGIMDSDGNLKKSLDFVYDTYNRLKWIVNPDRSSIQYSYDGKGNRTGISDPKGPKDITYDALDRVGTVTRANTETIYGFDTQDNPSSIQDPNSVTTQYKYDDFGKLNRIESLDSGTWNYARDDAGNLTGISDASGNTVVSYTYDLVNRPLTVSFPSDASKNITLSYDTGSNGKGRLTGRTDPSGSYVFSYDAQGNLITEAKTVGGVQYTIGYEYNKNRVLKSIVYPSGREVNYALDGADRITQVSTTLSGSSKTLASSVAYVPFGGVTGLTYGNGLNLTQSHDNQYRMTSVIAGPVVNLSYGYDANGNITSAEDKVNPPPSGVYGFTGIYTTQQGTNKLTNIDTTPTNFGYDGRGNIISENNRTYRYDSLNQLIQVLDNSVPIADYTYNGAGQRIKKVTASGTRIFHYDLSGHIIAETDASTNQTVEYVYVGDNLLAMVRQGSIYYFHNNNLGTPQVLTDASGNIVWKALYNPFGMAQIITQTVENPFRLPGQYYDAETGLHYNYFRYYHPKIGRYLTPDPIGLEGGLNLWAYALGNPVNKTDPSGLIAPQFVAASIGGAIGGTTAFITAYQSGARGWNLAGQTAVGTLSGAAAGFLLNPWLGMGANAVAGAAGNLASQVVDQHFNPNATEIDHYKVAISGAAGLAGGTLGALSTWAVTSGAVAPAVWSGVGTGVYDYVGQSMYSNWPKPAKACGK